MRLLAVAATIVLVFAVMFACRRRAPAAVPDGPISSWKIPERWSVDRGEKDGKPVFTRFNIGLKPFVGRPEFAHQLGIAVPLNAPTPHGLPTGAEALELNQVEDEIASRFLPGNESLFAGVITTNGMREFVLYTRDPQAALAKAAALAGDIRHHHIQFVIHDDPGWENFKLLAAGK
jgi:hypothetical protein